MKNTLLRKLSVFVLRAVGALTLLSLPDASAADDASGIMYTNAVFAREVQVNTTWWKKDGPLRLGEGGLLSSPAAMEEWFPDRFLRFRPHAESFDVTLRYQLTDMVSLYGGGWLLSTLEPGSLRPRTAKFGLDFASPWQLLDHSLQPVGAAEVLSHKDYDWSTDFSLRAGMRWNNLRAPDHSLSLMLECFVGNAKTTVPGARQNVDYVGLGLHYKW